MNEMHIFGRSKLEMTTCLNGNSWALAEKPRVIMRLLLTTKDQ